MSSESVRFSEVVPGIFRSPLPLARELTAFASIGGRTVVDLTQRPRPLVERACARHGLAYVKCPLPYEGGEIDTATACVLSAPRPVLFHCFHGRDRTGLVARQILMRERGRVVLYRVGRNLNRAVRTCEAFGIRTLELVECNGSVAGNLYGAAGRVDIQWPSELPNGPGVLALETWATEPIQSVDWSTVDTILIGGETDGLPRRHPVRFARIPMCGRVSGLTVEAALAVALHEWRTRC